MRLIVILAASLLATSAIAQEHQIEPAVHRCGIQFGNVLAQMDALGEEVDRLTVERDALKKELAAIKKASEASPSKP